jgi:origin recognition complex subunit 1
VLQSDYQVFEDNAIQFAARKTAALSGDIRKALHMCNAAAEAVIKDEEAGTRVDPEQGRGGPMVCISDVQKVSRECFSSILLKAITFSTSFEALLLVSLASLTQSRGRYDGGFVINELITKMEAISGGSCDVQYTPPPTFGETLDILNRLGEVRTVGGQKIARRNNLSLTHRFSESTCLATYPSNVTF